jgi:hypothetical protein
VLFRFYGRDCFEGKKIGWKNHLMVHTEAQPASILQAQLQSSKPYRMGRNFWMAYCGGAIVFSAFWLKRFKQGPAEWMLWKISGRLPANSGVFARAVTRPTLAERSGCR